MSLTDKIHTEQVEARQIERAEVAASIANPVKRGPGRPKKIVAPMPPPHLTVNQGQGSADAPAPRPVGGEMPQLPASGRVPFGARRQKLAWPEIPGFHLHWFNDDPGRIEEALQAGYVHVTKEGKNVQRVVGKTSGGDAQIAYLMKIPEQFYTEDQANAAAEREATMAAIRQGKHRAPEHGYVPNDRPIRIGDRR